MVSGLFYLRLRNLRKPVIFSVLPVAIIFNSWQFYHLVGITNASALNVLDVFTGIYYVAAIVLMCKKDASAGEENGNS